MTAAPVIKAGLAAAVPALAAARHPPATGPPVHALLRLVHLRPSAGRRTGSRLRWPNGHGRASRSQFLLTLLAPCPGPRPCPTPGPGDPQGRGGKSFYRGHGGRPVADGRDRAERVPQQRRPPRDVSGLELEDTEPGAGLRAQRRPGGRLAGLLGGEGPRTAGRVGQMPLPPGEFRADQVSGHWRVRLDNR